MRKLVDKLEQAENTMKLEESEKLILRCVNNVRKSISNINNIQDSDNETAEEITEILKI